MATLKGNLKKSDINSLKVGKHGDGGGLYLVVEATGSRRWIVRVTIKGQKNKKGGPLRTDFGLGSTSLVTLNEAREKALEHRRMAVRGLNPRHNATLDIPTFEEIAQQVHIDRMPTWKNAKHGQQWINTLRDYAFPKIGRMPVDAIGQPEAFNVPVAHMDRKARNRKAAGPAYQDCSGRGEVKRLSDWGKPYHRD